MSDTLNDTDWTAKSTERDLDKPTSSTTNRSHSPHLSLHARKSLEKNLNENFSKPRRKCSKCRKSGHNIATCPLIQKEKLNARAAIADLNFSLSHNPKNELLSEIPDNTPIKEDQKDEKKCVFCRKLVAVNDSGRPLLFCDSCVAADQLRCPIRVPAQLSLLASIPFAVVLRAFTENLRKGLWDVTPIWKFFLKKDKKLLSKKSNFKKNVFSKEKLVRKLALKGRFGSAKQCLFSSDLAECNETTLFQLNHLHPEENFHCTKPDSVDYWLQNPVNASEVLKLIQQMPTGKAPGPSLLNFDMIKSAVGQCPEIADDLVLFFNNLLSLKIKVPFEMTSARLIALKKSQSKIRPIAIGESFSRILASLVFNRIGKKAKEFFSPFQFGIKTIDGASSAALSSDVFFNSSDSNYIFNLDFKNAFNSVSRSSILPLLQKHFPEVEPFFYSFYGKSSTLVYENFDLLSSSGVKQGDPLGPFFFCLAIHPLMCELKEKFPEIDIVAYMDDISVIAPITILKQIATFIQQRYEDIGLSLNISKCLIIGHEPIDFFINDVNVPFINYDQSGFRFLGCYLGNIDEVKSQLSTLLTQFGNELESIENLNIEKHLKFFFLKICYSGKFTHILRSTSPSISLEFCRIFNEQRTNFLAKLLEIDASQLRSHIFCGTNFGGVDFHKSSYLCKAAFIGGGKNFIYEFVNRFPEKIHLIENCGSSYLISLQQEIETLSPNIWAKCFPSDLVELPSRSLLSLPLTFAKLQKKILKVLENLDYIVRLSLAKEKNPVFANFLIDLEDSCSSCLISQIPNIYGLLLNDHQWTTAMRLRCFLWPCSLPNDLICRCKSGVTLSHILNCKYFITYRSLVHDSVRDQLYAMCKSFNIEAFIEPLVRKLSSDQTDDSFGKRRADLVAPGIDGVLNVVDVVSVDVCKNSAARLVYSADSPLSNAEKKKIKKI
ncbi:hypothetical protein P9112_006127 [Eukaryota sp. TZLM1-RC]